MSVLTNLYKPLSFPNSEDGRYTHVHILRGIAAMMVCIYHCCLFQPSKGPVFAPGGLAQSIGVYGYQGVTIFFVISGFVIPFSMGKMNYTFRKAGRFLLKRSIRIEVPYIASMMVIIGLYFILNHIWGSSYRVNPMQLLMNITYLVPFTNGKYEWFAIIYWTLGVEFQFYLLMTLLFPLLNHDNKYVRYIVLILFACGPMLCNKPGILTGFSPSFLLGFLLYLMSAKKLNSIELLIFGCASIVSNYLFVTGTASVFASVAFIFIWFLHRVRFKTGMFMGEISYSFYLLHGVIVANFIQLSFEPSYTIFTRITLVITAVLACIIFAAAFWFTFEKPALYFSRKVKI
jgi:peptidoglycan/LPS O-acetylase OafA/YrhL